MDEDAGRDGSNGGDNGGTDDARKAELEARRSTLHIPPTPFSERVLPVIFVALGLLTLLLIVIAGAILFDVAAWR